MPGLSFRRLTVAALVYAMASLAAAGEIYSTMRNVNAVAEAHGFRLGPAPDIQPTPLPSDLTAAQAFEIDRPMDRPVTIGRLFTSCSCIQVEAERRTFGPGERAILILRNVRPTPPAGQVYAIFVQITSPVRTTLRYDTFVQSGSGPAALSAAADSAADTFEPPEVAPHPRIGGGSGAPAVLLDEELARFGEEPAPADAAPAETEAESAAKEEDDSPAIRETTTPAEQSSLDDLPQLAVIPPQLHRTPVTEEVMDGEELAEGYLAAPFAGEDAVSDTDPELPDGGDGDEVEGTADLVVAVDIDSDIPDFYAHMPPTPVPAAAAPEDTAPPSAEAAPVPEAGDPDPVISAMETSVAPPVAVASPQTQAPVAPPAPAAPAVAPAPERNPDAPKPVQAVSLITVGVRDMPRSIRFYEALGWRRAAPNKYDQTAFFQLQGQVLALYPMLDQLREQNMSEAAAPAPGGITLALHMNDKADVWSVYQRFIDAGGTSLRPPVEMASGAVTSYVADPDGNPWEISWVPQFRIDEDGGLWLP